MSGLWDYDDDDELDDDEDWGVQTQGEVIEDATPGKKRKGGGGGGGGRKAGRPKKQAVTPADADLQQVQRPIAILESGSDDDDDLVMLPSPVGVVRPGQVGASGPAQPLGSTPHTAGPPIRSVANLNPETQQSLAKEQELLRALQQATEVQPQALEDLDLGPVLTEPRVRPLALSSLANTGSRHASDGTGCGATATGLGGQGRAPEGPPAAAAAAGGCGERSGSADLDGTAATTAATPAAAEDRVLLKLVWASGKDGHLMMRVLKTDPIMKMIEKFRDLARQRSLCKDPKKIKFMFDGDDLAKTPNATPEDLDLEDDVMIDVKL